MYGSLSAVPVRNEITLNSELCELVLYAEKNLKAFVNSRYTLPYRIMDNHSHTECCLDVMETFRTIFTKIFHCALKKIHFLKIY